MNFPLKIFWWRSQTGWKKKDCVLKDLEVTVIKGLALDSLCVHVCMCMRAWVCACVCTYTRVHPSVICPQRCSSGGPMQCGQIRAGKACSYKERGPGWGTSLPCALWLEARVSITSRVQLIPFCKKIPSESLHVNLMVMLVSVGIICYFLV